MTRAEGWPFLLARWIEENRARPFQWGQWDCALFVAEAVRIQTGRDHSGEYRGTYSDEAGAYQRLLEVAGGGLYSAICRVLGSPLDTMSMAGRGDVLLVDTPAGPTCAVHLGSRMAMLTAENGIALIPVRNILAAWTV